MFMARAEPLRKRSIINQPLFPESDVIGFDFNRKIHETQKVNFQSFLLAYCKHGKADYEYDDSVKCYGKRTL